MELFDRFRRRSPELEQRISVADLWRRFSQKEPTVRLDVRQPHGLTDHPGSIPGSIRIPPDQLPERYGELPRDALIVAYCT